MNIVLAVVCAVVSLYAFHRMRAHRRDDADLYLSALGLGLFAGGFALQRIYWAINRSLEALGENYLLTVIYSTYSWITLIPLTVVLIGAGLLLSSLLSFFYGEYWLQKYLFTLFATWFLLAVLI